MSDLGTPGNPLRVAIVGSGPAGFYAADALLGSRQAVSVDMFERLAAPYGLVRSGVAPDHPKLKQVTEVYEQVAAARGFRFFGNVTVGRDISVEELRSCYHAVLLATGAQADRPLDIPGEHLPGSHAATEFVGWYNGHPDHRDAAFDLSHRTAVVIGQGNVALDVCRILGKTPDELRHTDIAAHALAALAESKVRDIYLVGRRGPAQVKFTHSELRELGALADCDPVVDPRDLVLDPASRQELADCNNRDAIKSYAVLRAFAARAAPARRRRCHFVFLRSPIELAGTGRLQRVLLMRNRLAGEPGHQFAEPTRQLEQIDCGLLLRSVGYRGVAITGVPFDRCCGVIPSRDGRVVDGHASIRGLYVAGWIKRGPTGVIGTNREDSVLTVNAMLADLDLLDRLPDRSDCPVDALLRHRGVRVVGYADWQTISAAEVERGRAAGKPREKFTRLEEMLDVAFGHEDRGENQ